MNETVILRQFTETRRLKTGDDFTRRGDLKIKRQILTHLGSFPQPRSFDVRVGNSKRSSGNLLQNDRLIVIYLSRSVDKLHVNWMT